MDLLDAGWHLLNFFAPALGLGLITAGLAKLVWWKGLRGTAWWRLGAWGSTGAALAAVGALVLFGREGRMAGYAAMVLACAVGVWWTGLRRMGR